MKSSQWRPAVKRAVVRKGITATAKLALELRVSRSCGVILVWWPVLISGLLPGLAGRVTSPYSYPEFSRISLRIHHNGKSTDFEQNLGPVTTINLNALTCCALVSSEVSHRTATMVSRCRACMAWLAHSGYPLGHVPRSPRTAIDACAIRRMLSHLEAHSAI